MKKKQTKNIIDDTSSKKDLKKSEKEKVKSEKKHKKSFAKKIEKRTSDLIDTKEKVDDGYTGFKYYNGGYVNIFQVVPYDYQSATDEELMLHINAWDKLYRTCGNSMRIISINMPVDVSSQLMFYKHKYNSIKNPNYRQRLAQEIECFENDFKDRESKEFYLGVFADNYEAMLNLNEQIISSLCDKKLVIEISPVKKIEVLSKFGNPYNTRTDIG